jgi:hypothetical protein
MERIRREIGVDTARSSNGVHILTASAQLLSLLFTYYDPEFQ